MALVHICIASRQHQPNVLPLLHFRPDHVYILASTTMQQQGRELRQLACDVLGADRHVECIEGFPEAQPAEIARETTKVLARIRAASADASIVFNATGGTKLMAIAIADSLDPAVDVLYCDTSSDQIAWLRPRARLPEPLPSLLDLPRVAACMGRQVVGTLSAQGGQTERRNARAAPAASLFELAAKLDESAYFGALNMASSEALNRSGDQLRAPRQTLVQYPNARFKDVLKALASLGGLTLEGKTLEFRNVDTARFLGGGWLEEHVHALASQCGFDATHLGVTLALTEGGARNEIDVLVIHRNHVLLVECKTISAKAAKGSDGDLIYKLDSVGTSIGGLLATRWLVSVHPLQYQAERARASGITVTSGERLAGVKDALLAWKQTGKLPPTIDDHAPPSMNAVAARFARR